MKKGEEVDEKTKYVEKNNEMLKLKYLDDV